MLGCLRLFGFPSGCCGLGPGRVKECLVVRLLRRLFIDHSHFNSKHSNYHLVLQQQQLVADYYYLFKI
jgi:hypothetical protein